MSEAVFTQIQYLQEVAKRYGKAADATKDGSQKARLKLVQLEALSTALKLLQNANNH